MPKIHSINSLELVRTISHSLTIDYICDINKEKRYQAAIEELKALALPSEKSVSILSNASAILKSKFDFWWIGFYLVEVEKNQMYLGPFQGPVACQSIPYGKGVCGTAWKRRETIVVPNVHEFPGHIACSADSNSEIVVPLKTEIGVHGVLDVDSVDFDCFDAIDERYLEEFCSIISEVCFD